MKINYNATGAERKRLVKYIAGFLGCDAEYQGAPTFAYKVGYITVDRYGAMNWEDHESLNEEILALVRELEDEGFTAEDPDPQPTALTVTVPMEALNLENLKGILDAKGNLIKKALGIEELPVEVSEDKVAFPWFSNSPDAEAAKAYTRFISALCRMSRELTRVQSKEKEVENEKYAFRCFLIRLGYKGDEYKADRRILLRNLTGSSAFKSGHRKEAGHAVSES